MPSLVRCPGSRASTPPEKAQFGEGPPVDGGLSPLPNRAQSVDGTSLAAPCPADLGGRGSDLHKPYNDPRICRR